jgi:hypothetical protein
VDRLRYGDLRQHQEGPLARQTLQAAPGTRRDPLGAFLVARANWVATAPKTSQGLLKRLVSHFAYDESPAVRTRICCVEAADPTARQPKGPQGLISRIQR